MSKDILSIDIGAAADEGAWCHLEHPSTREPLYLDEQQQKPIRVRVMGTDGKKGTAIKHKYEKQKRNLLLGTKAKGDPAKEHDLNCHMLAELTVQFENVVDPETNESIEANPGSAYKLYKARLWIFEQLDQFAGDRGNFLQP